MREGFQNSLGWPEGMLSPPFALVVGAEMIVIDDEDVMDVFAELVAVTVTVAGEGTAGGAV
jgi:hypothetical protein